MPISPLVLAVFLLLPVQRAELAPTGTLRASFIENNPVQGRVDARTGAVTGPASDLVRELARRLGVPFVITPMPNAGAVLESVRSGKVDIGFLAYEAARAAQVEFSDPYSSSGSAYAVRGDSTYRNSADVDRAGVTIGAISGQSPEVYVREHVKNARVQSLPTVPPNAALGRLLLDGKVDAFAANRTRMEELVREFPALRVLADDFTATLQAIVVPKGSRTQLDQINRFLAEVRKSGFVKASLERADLAGVTVAPEPKR
ncbi:MAG: transporter substrate-binding domain-containing protein [Acidobacteria bacterium]|nr:transporter substrate-binding domain-containing protein [Acidobacteriota bacterium]